MNHFEMWILGWIEVAQGVISILTLGHVYTHWDMEWCYWASVRKFKKSKKKIINMLKD